MLSCVIWMWLILLSLLIASVLLDTTSKKFKVHTPKGDVISLISACVVVHLIVHAVLSFKLHKKRGCRAKVQDNNASL